MPCLKVKCIHIYIYICTYPSDGLRAGGGCEAAVTASRRYWSDKLRECAQLLNIKIFSPKLKMDVNKSYVRPAIP